MRSAVLLGRLVGVPAVLGCSLEALAPAMSSA
jgi:hypothetical protein